MANEISYKEIALTKGRIALIDEEDFDDINQFKWCAARSRNHWYALRRDYQSGKSVLMHRQLLNVVDAGTEIKVDHINNNGLDNRRFNLRLATNSQNLANSFSAFGKSKYKGVSPGWKSGKWRAGIKLNYISIHLGTYNSEEEAALAYDKAARDLFGEYAQLNF